MKLSIAYKGLVRQIMSQAVISSIDYDKSVAVNAVWDTGATKSFISDSVAKALQLEEAGKATVNHISGSETLSIYSAAVELQGGLIFKELPLVTFSNVRPFDMIIGMDIIKLGRFLIENKNGNTVFCFRYQ